MDDILNNEQANKMPARLVEPMSKCLALTARLELTTFPLNQTKLRCQQRKTNGHLGELTELG